MTGSEPPYHTILIGITELTKKIALPIAKAGYPVAVMDTKDTFYHPSSLAETFAQYTKTAEKEQLFSVMKQYVRKRRKETTERWWKQYGIHFYSGNFHVPNARTVTIMGGNDIKRNLQTRNLVFVTGSQTKNNSTLPPAGRITTLESVFSLPKKPSTVAVLGNTPTAIHSAWGFATAGTTTHLITGGHAFNALPDEIASAAIRILKQQGIIVHGAADTFWMKKNKLIIKKGRKSVTIPSVAAIIDTRVIEPNTHFLLSHIELGIILHEKKIMVNKKQETRIKGVFAAGEVYFAETEVRLPNIQAQQVVRSILHPFRQPMPSMPEIKTMYTIPQIAIIGTTFNRESSSFFTPLRILYEKNNKNNAMVYLKIRKLTGRIIEITLLAPHATELIPFLSTIISRRISAWELTEITASPQSSAALLSNAAGSFERITLKNFFRELISFILGNIIELFQTFPLKLFHILLWSSILITLFKTTHGDFTQIVRLTNQTTQWMSSTQSNGMFLFFIFGSLYHLWGIPYLAFPLCAGYIFGAPHGVVLGMLIAAGASFLGYLLPAPLIDTKKLPYFTIVKTEKPHLLFFLQLMGISPVRAGHIGTHAHIPLFICMGIIMGGSISYAGTAALWGGVIKSMRMGTSADVGALVLLAGLSTILTITIARAASHTFARATIAHAVQ